MTDTPPTGKSGVSRPRYMSGPLTLTAAPPIDVNNSRHAFSICAPDGRALLAIHADGTVTGTVEDATEAGKAFVAYLREHLQNETPATIYGVGDDRSVPVPLSRPDYFIGWLAVTLEGKTLLTDADWAAALSATTRYAATLPASTEISSASTPLRGQVEIARAKGEWCCEIGCESGECGQCGCCRAGSCVMAYEGVPEDPDELRAWLKVAGEYNHAARELESALSIIRAMGRLL